MGYLKFFISKNIKIIYLFLKMNQLRLETLPNDVFFTILLDFLPNKLIRLCQINANFNNKICQSNENSWFCRRQGL
jgi:hypothetical protein